MGLNHGDDLPLARLARGAQHGGNLDRMVAVIVNDRYTVPLAGAREAPPHAAKAGERLADEVVADTELPRDRDRRSRVESVMPAGHGESQAADFVRRLPGAVAEHD